MDILENATLKISVRDIRTYLHGRGYRNDVSLRNDCLISEPILFVLPQYVAERDGKDKKNFLAPSRIAKLDGEKSFRWVEGECHMEMKSPAAVHFFSFPPGHRIAYVGSRHFTRPDQRKEYLIENEHSLFRASPKVWGRGDFDISRRSLPIAAPTEPTKPTKDSNLSQCIFPWRPEPAYKKIARQLVFLAQSFPL